MDRPKDGGSWPLASKLVSPAFAVEEFMLQRTDAGMERDDQAKSLRREMLTAVVLAHSDADDGAGRCGVGRSRRQAPGIHAKQWAGTGATGSGVSSGKWGRPGVPIFSLVVWEPHR
jgi:hypothetical protein